MALKRLVRRFVPDRLMARVRLRQHSAQARTAVTVLVGDRRSVRTWLGVVPDTYRVVFDSGPWSGDDIGGVVLVGDQDDARRAAGALVEHGLDAVVVGDVAPPTLVRRRRSEPGVAPRGIAVTPGALADVGGLPPGGDLVALHERLRDAGHGLGLVPSVVSTRVEAVRRDPIEAPAVVVVSGVPMHDVGGGSRASQLAQELVRRGAHVTFAALFGTHESADLGIRFVHPRLEQRRIDQVDPGVLDARVSEPGLVLVEMPAPHALPAVEELASRGWTVVYDVIDRWADPALGGQWYDEAVEQRFVGLSSVVIASAGDLTIDGAVLVPNAVNHRLFSAPPGPIPDDFPSVEGPVLGYHGSLYGTWFDWDGLVSVAEAHLDATIVVIGDVPRSRPAVPGNVSFLGLKSQHLLPAYVGRFDVGLLPFVVSETTHAVSPLKVFEYLASGVPVAAPPLRSLDGLPVHTAADLVDAVGEALAAPPLDPIAAVAGHTWESRVDHIVDMTGLRVPDGVDDPVRVEMRPARHLRGADRRTP